MSCLFVALQPHPLAPDGSLGGKPTVLRSAEVRSGRTIFLRHRFTGRIGTGPTCHRGRFRLCGGGICCFGGHGVKAKWPCRRGESRKFVNGFGHTRVLRNYMEFYGMCGAQTEWDATHLFRAYVG